MQSAIKTTIASPETSGVCGADLTWYYRNGVLVITGTGEMADYEYSGIKSPWRDLGDKIGWVIVDDGATSIGELAFCELGVMNRVVLPNTLETIRGDAFYCCDNLKEVTLPDSLKRIEGTIFEGCDIQTLKMSDNIEHIGGSIGAETIVYKGTAYGENEFDDLMIELGIM